MYRKFISTRSWESSLVEGSQRGGKRIGSREKLGYDVVTMKA